MDSGGPLVLESNSIYMGPDPETRRLVREARGKLAASEQSGITIIISCAPHTRSAKLLGGVRTRAGACPPCLLEVRIQREGVRFGIVQGAHNCSSPGTAAPSPWNHR